MSRDFPDGLRLLAALRISSSQGPFSMGMRLASSQLGSNTIATTCCKAIFLQASRQCSLYLFKLKLQLRCSKLHISNRFYESYIIIYLSVKPAMELESPAMHITTYMRLFFILQSINGNENEYGGMSACPMLLTLLAKSVPRESSACTLRKLVSICEK